MAVLTATNGNVQLAPGELVNTPASAFAVAALFYRAGTTTDGYEALTALATAGGQVITSIGSDAAAEPYEVRIAHGGQTRTFGFDDLNDDDAYLFYVYKLDGDVTPRANLYRFATAAWDGWADGSDTLENRGDTIALAWLLNQNGGFPWNGGIYVAGWWESPPAESAITDSSTGLQVGVQQWLDLGPVALWRPGETNPVEDEHDYPDPGTANETSRSNVTIVDQDPPDFNMEFGGPVTVTGELIVTLPAFSAAVTGSVLVDGTLQAQLPALTSDFDGEVRVDGLLTSTLPPLSSAFSGDVISAGQLDATLPALTSDIDGQVRLGGTLSAGLPALQQLLSGAVRASGALDAQLPALQSALAGQVLQDVIGQLNAQLPPLGSSLIGVSEATPPTPGVDPMTLAFTIVTGVGECIVQELAETEGGMPNRVCLAVPGEIAWDECQCGQFAQSITQSVPSENFPIAATDRRTTACGPQHLVFNVTASLTRCVPTIDARSGRPPDCAALFKAARILEEDRFALRRGVTCCLKALRDAYILMDFTVGTAVTVGPQGQCAGVELTYQFGIRNVCCGFD